MGTCKAELHIADDFGDNHATMHCQLEEGHTGPHRERFFDETQGRREGARGAVVKWFGDDRDETQS